MQVSPDTGNGRNQSFDGAHSPGSRMQAQLDAKEETSSISSDKYEKDVNVLNRYSKIKMQCVRLCNIWSQTK